MYGLAHWQFWLSAIWFVIALFVSLYVPGSVLLRKTKLNGLIHGLLAFGLGLTLWGFQGYILGYLNLRWVTYLYLLFFSLIWLLSFSFEKERLWRIGQEIRQLPLLVWLVILGGSLIQVAQVWGTGLRFGNDIRFFGVNAYDGVLHLAFIQELVKQVPAEQPGAFGLQLNHYHYWSDLMAADLHRIWQLPIIHLFFQYMPIVLAIGAGLAAYQAVKCWQGNTHTAVWSLLILYGAGDLVYVFTLLLHGNWGSQVAAIDNGATQLLNMPHAYAKFVFLTSLIPLTFWLKKQSLSWGVLTALLMASLFGLKVYFGIFAALGMSFILGIYLGQIMLKTTRKQGNLLQLLHDKLWFFGPYFLLALTAAAIYFPANRDAGGLYWAPLKWPELLLSADHINWPAWWILKAASFTQNIPLQISLDLIAIIICLLSVFGMRLIGLIPHPAWHRQLSWQVLVFLWPTSLVCIFLGLYTLQVSGLFNVFNFFAIAAVPMALMAGFTLDAMWQQKSLFYKLLPVLVMSLGLPRIIMSTGEIVSTYVSQDFERQITADQLAALEFLRTQTPSDSIIQTHPGNYFNHQTTPLAYFANRQTYLTGVKMLESHNQPIADRQAQIKKIFDSTASLVMRSEMHAFGIDYLYLEKNDDEKLPFTLPDDTLPAVFENDQVLILEVRP